VNQPLRVLAPAPVVVEDLHVRIDRDEVLRFQGYKTGMDVPTEAVLALFDEAVALGHELMTPRMVYRSVPVSGQSAHLIEAGGERLHIPEIGRLWGSLAAVGVAICTAGEAIETRVRTLFEARDFPLAVMLDSVGSAAVESLAEYANDLLCQVALPEGLRVSNRISPGYAGWDTAEQAALFRLCPGHPIGVSLNSACFMSPTKSISLLVGVGPEARVDHYFTQCRRCWMRDCAYRRAPAQTTVHR
jgi:Vitamin B12 dependent methionine synthase, activation domain